GYQRIDRRDDRQGGSGYRRHRHGARPPRPAGARRDPSPYVDPSDRAGDARRRGDRDGDQGRGAPSGRGQEDAPGTPCGRRGTGWTPDIGDPFVERTGREGLTFSAMIQTSPPDPVYSRVGRIYFHHLWTERDTEV